jgi:hypothetical protein
MSHGEVMDAIERRLYSDGVRPEGVEIVAQLDFCQGLRGVAAMDGAGRMAYRMITGKVDVVVGAKDHPADRIVVARLDTTPLFEVLIG